MEIADSARKHGIADEDIRHAVRVEFRAISQGDRLLIIGADRAGRLLEIVVLDPDGDPVFADAYFSASSAVPNVSGGWCNSVSTTGSTGGGVTHECTSPQT